MGIMMTRAYDLSMSTTVNINDYVLERAETLAHQSGKTLSSVIEDALKESSSRRERL